MSDEIIGQCPHCKGNLTADHQCPIVSAPSSFAEPMVSKTKLLPCPTCNKVPTIKHKQSNWCPDGINEVRCDCPRGGFDGLNHTRRDSIKEWNRKVTKQPSIYGPGFKYYEETEI